MFNYNLQFDKIIDNVKTDNPMDIYRFISEKYKICNTIPILKLKFSSSIPILFVSFNQNDQDCFHCGDEYIQAPYNQRYCKKCLLCYIIDITDNNAYLDVNTFDSPISSEQVESTFIKKPIPVLCLPWWDNKNSCIACNSELEFMSDCQRYCAYCCIIYIGCRYCLTTNIIFGFTDQSQCKKCKRISFIIDMSINIDDFLYNLMFNHYNLQLAKIIDDIKKTDNSMDIYKFIGEKLKIYNTNLM